MSENQTKKEVSQIEMLLDENNTDNIKLYDENNKETEFEQVAIIPVDDKIYAILKPVNELAGVNEDEALVFVIEEIDDEEVLVIVDDEEIVDKVFNEYYDLLKEEGIDVDDLDSQKDSKAKHSHKHNHDEHE